MRKIDNVVNEFITRATKELEIGVLIYENDSGYTLFEQYTITKRRDWIEASRNSDSTVNLFSSLKNATAWCVLDRYNKIVEAKRLIQLDQNIAAITAERLQHGRLRKRGTLESKEISRDKYLQALDKQNRFQWEIDKYIQMAKKCQNKGYQNELTRTSRK
jgi:hypothetical protein